MYGKGIYVSNSPSYSFRYSSRIISKYKDTAIIEKYIMGFIKLINNI